MSDQINDFINRNINNIHYLCLGYIIFQGFISLLAQISKFLISFVCLLDIRNIRNIRN